MPYKFIVQLIITILSLVVIFNYISPKFTELQAQQVEIAKFKDVADKAEQFNSKLANLLNNINSLSQSDLRTLKNFLPESVDSVSVLQDIESIAIKSGVRPTSLQITGEAESENSNEPVQYIQDNGNETKEAISAKDLNTYEYSFTVSGTYNNFINFLRALENNKYPLQVASLDISSAEGTDGQVVTSYEMVVKTFSFTKAK